MSSNLIQKRVAFRKIGRPTGSGRVPLTLDERRARNAECERERRVVMRDAINELAAAAGLRNNMTVVDLLAEVVTFINTSNMLDDNLDMDELRQRNDVLAHQIAMLEHRLATDPDPWPSVQPSPGPMKRKAQGYEWPNPPPKRLSPAICVMGSSDSQRHDQASEAEVRSLDRLSFCHRVQPETSSCRLEPVWTPQTSCRQPISVAMLSCREDQISPVSCDQFLHRSHPSSSPSYCVTVEPNVKDEDLADMTAIWTEALDVAIISRLSLSHMDLRATEQELVELYLL